MAFSNKLVRVQGYSFFWFVPAGILTKIYSEQEPNWLHIILRYKTKTNSIVFVRKANPTPVSDLNQFLL
jgi:hypothetical protein